MKTRADIETVTSKTRCRVNPHVVEMPYPNREYRRHLNTKSLRAALDGPQHAARDEMRKILSKLKPFEAGSLEEQRKVTLSWCRELAKAQVGSPLFPEPYGSDDLAQFSANFEMLAYFDLNLTIKFGVQWGLFGGSVLNLGTKKHHDQVLSAANDLSLPGCFAMTEIGHGSNVRQIETTAIYNHDTQSFTLHSPSWNAGKTYIGNAARDGEMATVFAQLKIKGMWKGVHAFLVPIRTPEKDLKRGVFIEDNGQKIGLNGVDNGMIWFDHVTLPKDALLDRFASIDEYGEWSSPIDGDAKRFFTMLGTLVGGRISIAGTSVKATQKALTISTLYAHRRRQFGRDGESESLIIDYPTHQKRIGEGLATTIALSIAIQNLAETNARGSASRDIETRAAALKAYSTWESMRIVQNCREACGGEGYMWKNQIGSIKADMDIFTTFEGDNTVLMQLACKGLLKKLAARFQSGELSISKVVLNELRGQLRKITVPGQRTNWHNLTTIGDLLLARENDLTLTLAQEMRKQKKQGLDNHDIMLDHQIDMIEVSTAYAERLTYQSMVGRYIELKDSRTDQETLTLWKTLTISFGLERILRNPQWFYNENHLNKETQKSASITLKTTYQKIAENSTDIVNAFGIPENAMTAPIAK